MWCWSCDRTYVASEAPGPWSVHDNGGAFTIRWRTDRTRQTKQRNSSTLYPTNVSTMNRIRMSVRGRVASVSYTSNTPTEIRVLACDGDADDDEMGADDVASGSTASSGQRRKRKREWTRADAPHLRRRLYVKPMLLPHGGWPMAAGPVSRLGSFEPGINQGCGSHHT